MMILMNSERYMEMRNKITDNLESYEISLELAFLSMLDEYKKINWFKRFYLNFTSKLSSPHKNSLFRSYYIDINHKKYFPHNDIELFNKLDRLICDFKYYDFIDIQSETVVLTSEEYETLIELTNIIDKE